LHHEHGAKPVSVDDSRRAEKGRCHPSRAGDKGPEKASRSCDHHRPRQPPPGCSKAVPPTPAKRRAGAQPDAQESLTQCQSQAPLFRAGSRRAVRSNPERLCPDQALRFPNDRTRRAITKRPRRQASTKMRRTAGTAGLQVGRPECTSGRGEHPSRNEKPALDGPSCSHGGGGRARSRRRGSRAATATGQRGKRSGQA